MKTVLGALRGFAIMGCTVGGLLTVAACTGDDDQVTAPGRRDASVDATSTMGTGDANTLAPAAAICAKYGMDKVQQVVASLATNLKADCRVGVYFTELPDQGAHFSACLNLQLATLFGCPGASYGGEAKDPGGKLCRNMKDAHKDLGIREADFKAFTDDAIAALNANGIKDTADVQSIVSALGTTDTAVVSNQGKYDARCTCPGGVYMGNICVVEAGVDPGTDSGGGDADIPDSAPGTDGATGTDSGSNPDAGADAADGD